MQAPAATGRDAAKLFDIDMDQRSGVRCSYRLALRREVRTDSPVMGSMADR